MDGWMDGWVDEQTSVTVRAPRGERGTRGPSGVRRTGPDAAWLQPHLQTQEETRVVASE